MLVPPQVKSHSDSFPLIPWLPRVEGRGRFGLAPVRVWADHPLLPAGSRGATLKYKVWMRHRYQSCCNRLGELLAHPSFQVKVSWGGWLCLLLHRPCPTFSAQQGYGAVTADPSLGKDILSFCGWFPGLWVLSPDSAQSVVLQAFRSKRLSAGGKVWWVCSVVPLPPLLLGAGPQHTHEVCAAGG